MDQLIIYQAPGGSAVILTPILSSGLTLEEIAEKDVPRDVPYWFVEKFDIDGLYAKYGELRDAWEVSAGSIGRLPNGVGK